MKKNVTPAKGALNSEEKAANAPTAVQP